MKSSKRYDRIDELGEEVQAQLRKWRKEIESSEAPPTAQQIVRELRDSIEADLNAVAPEIDALRSAAINSEAQAKRAISELKIRRKALKAKLSELKDEGFGDDIEVGVTKAWAAFRPALQGAIAKFK